MGSDNLKKIPQRTCIGCNVQKNKSDLIKLKKYKGINYFFKKKLYFFLEMYYNDIENDLTKSRRF